MIKQVKDLIILLLIIAAAIAAYFAFKPKPTPPFNLGVNQNTEVISTQYIVDSLLVVVDSLTVQVDSLNSIEDHIIFLEKVTEKDVDTAFIISQYYSKYKHTIKHRDSSLYMKFDFTLNKNKIQVPRLEYKLLGSTTVIHTKPIIKNHYFFGTSLGGSENGIKDFSAQLLLTKRNHAISIGYNLLDPEMNLRLGYYFKIR